MSDPRHSHEFVPSRKRFCKAIIGTEICHKSENDSVHELKCAKGIASEHNEAWLAGVAAAAVLFRELHPEKPHSTGEALVNIETDVRAFESLKPTNGGFSLAERDKAIEQRARSKQCEEDLEPTICGHPIGWQWATNTVPTGLVCAICTTEQRVARECLDLFPTLALFASDTPNWVLLIYRTIRERYGL